MLSIVSVLHTCLFMYRESRSYNCILPLEAVGVLPVGSLVTSSLPIHLVKFCLNSGVSASSRTVVTCVQLGYFFCWMKSWMDTEIH